MDWQEDAHEFARYLIEAMHQSCLKAERRKVVGPQQETTFVYQAFGGRLRSQVSPCVESHPWHLGIFWQIERGAGLLRSSQAHLGSPKVGLR